MEEARPWSNEEQIIKDGKERCNQGFASTKEVNYQSTGWPDSFPNNMTPELYEKFYGPKLNLPPSIPDKLKILCMTWNTESINICAYGTDNKWYGKTYPPLFRPDKCYKAIQLINRIKDMVLLNSVDILVFGFQESAKPGDYFMSFSLPQFLKDIGYVLIKRERAIGAGLTTLTKRKLRGLRMSVFAKRSIYENIDIKVASSSFRPCGSNVFEKMTQEIVRGKGGLQFTIDIDGFRRYMFVNYHLPFKASRLNPTNPDKDLLLSLQTECFKGTYKKFIEENKPDYSFVFGDLNYRVKGMNENQMFNQDNTIKKNYNHWYENYDELNRLIKEISETDKALEGWEDIEIGKVILSEHYKGFREGPNDDGPGFAPTCKMMKGRGLDCTDRFCYQVTHKDGNLRLPSWCDRILYSHRNANKPHIEAIIYDRIDSDVAMTCSDHAGVYGIFNIFRS